MKVTFLGVGEAFDDDNTNTCMLIEAAGRRMLVDCGATAPPSIWKQSERPDYLDENCDINTEYSLIILLFSCANIELYIYLSGSCPPELYKVSLAPHSPSSVGEDSFVIGLIQESGTDI